MKKRSRKLRVIFLTNNITVTKPLILWLRTKAHVLVWERRPSKKILQKFSPDIIISYNYKYIVSREILRQYKIINLHISYLPYNRGAHPNIWAHIENTPSGVTMHWMDVGIDTGDIIKQKRIVLDEELTLKESYKKLHYHMQQLFKRYFNTFASIKPKKQNSGTFHRKQDIEKLSISSFSLRIKDLKKLYRIENGCFVTRT